MATAVVEQIAVKLQTRIELVTETGGYEVTVVSVIRPKRLGQFSPRDKLVIITQDDPIKNAEYESSTTRTEWIQPFWISCFVVPSDLNQTEAIDTQINALRSAVEKAICTSPTAYDWAQWDNLAINSTFDNPQIFAPVDGQWEGIALKLDVIYRVTPTDPYTAAV